MTQAAPTVVWTEIPVSDIQKGADFYSAVFGWTMTVDTTMGPDPMANFSPDMAGMHGHLYEGTPGSGSTIHLALPDSLEAGMERCRAAGGKILGEPVPLPVGRFVYATDPDGNSIGLFERQAA